MSDDKMEFGEEVEAKLDLFLVDELSLRCGDKGTCTIEHGGVRFTVVRNDPANEKPKMKHG